MKKQVIAAAVAAAFAVPAVAQVTIKGNIDLSYDGGKGNSSTKVLTSSRLTTSDLQMSGSEDLGGGLKAFFDINTGLSNVFGNGTLTGPTSGTNSLFYAAGSGMTSGEGGLIHLGDRGNRIGISGGFGTLAFGKTTGTATNTLRGGVLGNLSVLSAGGGAFADDRDRPKDTIDYTSPAFSGVTVRALVQTSSQDYELSASYAKGPLQLGVAALTDRSANKNDISARAIYNFGPLAATVNYQNMKGGTSSATETNAVGTFTSFGVVVPMGSISLMAEAQNRPDSIGKAVNLGAVYNLSKRTNAYAVYSKNQRSTAATAAETRVFEANALMGVGVRHSF